MARPAARAWTDFDEGLLHALWVVASRLRNDENLIHYVNPHFVIDYAGGERAYAVAPFSLLEYAAPGDGTYLHDSGFFFAMGRAGLAMTAAVAAGRAVGNSRRRQQAALSATPRWMPVDAGSVWVSTRGFWIETRQGLFQWPWADVQGMFMIRQGAVQVQGQSAVGPINWQIVSPLAEMIFGVWVLDRQIPHPQWMQRSWIPPNWIPWAATQGKTTPFRDSDEVVATFDGLPSPRPPTA